MKKIHKDTDKYFTITQLAEILGISRVAVHKRIKKGEIEAIKIGNMYAIPKSYVAEIFGRSVSRRKKEAIDKAVRKVVKEYGDTLIRLGNE
jgi:excisionase family DNA binding protein